MKEKTLLVLFVVLMLLAASLYSSQSSNQAGSQQRYQIVMHPLAMRGTYLLDTLTGWTWVLNEKKEDEDKEGFIYWVSLPRVDSTKDGMKFFPSEVQRELTNQQQGQLVSEEKGYSIFRKSPDGFTVSIHGFSVGFPETVTLEEIRQVMREEFPGILRMAEPKR